MGPLSGGRASSSTAARTTLLERDAELSQLQELIDEACAGAGRVVLIEAPAGIGKTALLHAARELAERAEMRLLVARGREVEQEFVHGVTRQLLERALSDAGEPQRERWLDGAARLAWPLFEHSESPIETNAFAAPTNGELRFALVHGLYWLLVNLADDGPVLVAVDDAQWADLPSLRFLSYLGARARELSVLVVVTTRKGEPTAAHELLSDIRGDLGTVVMAPEALSRTAVRAFVQREFDEPVEQRFSDACEHASAGNPLLLRELILELRAEHPDPSVAHVEGVRPDSVRRMALTRLARLGGDARTLARALAVLEKAPLRQAAALARLDEATARAAADRLVAAEIAARSPAMAFVHPLLRRTIYESIPPAARADGHRRAGLLLAADGIRGAQLASHLLWSEPTGDPEIVELLRGAARQALAGGEPLAAARLLQRALDEPPPAELLGVVLGELGEAEALARVPTAAAHLDRALDLSPPQARVRLACVLGEQLVWNGLVLEAHALLTATIAALGDGADPALLAALETIRTGAASVDQRLVAEIEPRLGELHELALAAGPAGRALQIIEGGWRAQRGPYDGDWRELLDRGLDGGRFIAAHGAAAAIVDYAAAVLVLADELPRARKLLADIQADARRRGSIHSHLTGLTWAALLALRCGELSQSQADARTALELSRQHGMVWTQAWATAVLGQALLDSGELAAAEAIFVEAPLEQVRASSAALHLLLARGRCRLAQGRTTEARGDFEAAGATVIVNNPSYIPWRSALALALAFDERGRAVALVEQELDRARELGQPRGIGVALRARGLLAVDGLPELNEAVRTLRGSPARLELARALLELGAAQRRAGQRAAARDPLREALELAARCGAEPLAQRARDELLATGAHPRRERLSGPEALTPSERRVADLAAGGLTNREIAQALFVTTKTVGTHLGHIYQKLDLEGSRARELLGERLTAPQP